MKKNEKYVISISLNAISTAYLEAIFNYSDKSTLSSVFRSLVKNNFEDILEAEACYTCLLSAEFDSFPNSQDFTIQMDKESLDLLDCLVDETGMSRSAVLRGLVIREFGGLQLALRQSIHQTEIS